MHVLPTQLWAEQGIAAGLKCAPLSALGVTAVPVSHCTAQSPAAILSLIQSRGCSTTLVILHCSFISWPLIWYEMWRLVAPPLAGRLELHDPWRPFQP